MLVSPSIWAVSAPEAGVMGEVRRAWASRAVVGEGRSSPTTDSLLLPTASSGEAKGSGRGCQQPWESCCQRLPCGEPGGLRSRVCPRMWSPSLVGSGFTMWSPLGSAQRDGVLGTSSVFCFWDCDIWELVCSAGPPLGGATS